MVKTPSKQTAPSLPQRLRNIPKRPIIIGGALIALLFAASFFLWPKNILLAYDKSPCIIQPLLAPGLMRSSSKDYVAVPDKVIKIGDVPVAAGGVCIHPTVAPKSGDHHLAFTFLGIPFLGRHVTVKASDSPQVASAVFTKPLPVSKPLSIALDSPDALFSYRFSAGGKTIPCTVAVSQLQCDVPRLGLAQGATYEVTIDRTFNGGATNTILKSIVATLPAVGVTNTSIKAGEIVYAKPKSFIIQLDKPLKTAHAAVSHSDGKTSIPTQVTVQEGVVSIAWADDLPREADIIVTLKQAEAADGSSLIEPFVLPFKTSGGPKVKSISVGTSRVPVGAMATITFDQQLSEKQDLSQVATLSGGATIAGRKTNQLLVSFAAVPKCGEVTIKINNNLQSSYDIAGGSAWQYATRTQCHTIGSIGTSVRGRSIPAYYFGTGPTTVIYTGAIHGDELSTRSLMMRWIDELEAKARSIPADKSIIVVPVINPDGVASGTRTNANKVDLNRNFNTSDWRKDITTVTNAPFPGGGGSSPMSEPETRAIAGLVSRTRPQLVLSYHSIGGVVAANQAGISSVRAGTYRGLSGYGNATGSAGESVFEYSVSGTADDYYAQSLGVGSLLIELGSHSYHQFERNQKAMWAMLN